jgi:hypothetical protein
MPASTTSKGRSRSHTGPRTRRRGGRAREASGREAFAACDKNEAAVDKDKLDLAKELDPQGEKDSEVTQARARIHPLEAASAGEHGRSSSGAVRPMRGISAVTAWDHRAHPLGSEQYPSGSMQ